jgi:putative tryptophan/tyrosine transport system substrate-binding protein
MSPCGRLAVTPMRRRTFFTLLIGFIACPFAGQAQSPNQPVIGFLNIGSSNTFAPFVAAFHKGLNAGGYVEGRNVTIEYRWAEGNYDRLKAQAADLVHRHVDLIVATGGLVSARAAKEVTDSIPILNIFGFNPVGEGLVTSFNRPGGNVTGVSAYASELTAKRLELLRELVPGIVKFAVLLNPNTRADKFERPDLERAAREKQLQLLVLDASAESEVIAAFDAAVTAGAAALVLSPDGFFTSRRGSIVELAANHRLPVVYPWREYAMAGGLMSYGPSIPDAYRQIGDYASRILKGAKPSDLPVQMPTTFELVINLKTAKALGIEVPYPLLATATEVIE